MIIKHSSDRLAINILNCFRCVTIFKLHESIFKPPLLNRKYKIYFNQVKEFVMPEIVQTFLPIFEAVKLLSRGECLFFVRDCHFVWVVAFDRWNS
jgi:hypothetical protein